MPERTTYYQQLQSDYKGRDIVFLSISIDNDNDHHKWREMVMQNKGKVLPSLPVMP